MGVFDEGLVIVLACPMCKGSLSVNREKSHLHCRECDVKFPIVDGIPMLMPPELKVE